MSIVDRNPLFRGALDPEAARVSRTVVGHHTIAVAEVANAALLDHPPARFTLSDLSDSGVYSVGFTPSPSARYLFLRWRITRSVTVLDNAAVDLSVTDTSGNAVSSGTGEVPAGFRGETFFARLPFSTDRFSDAAEQNGVIDLDAMRGTLTDPDWSLDFNVTLTGGAEVQQIEGWEVPRFVIDDGTAGRGVIPSSFGPGRLVTNATPGGLQRLLATIEAGRTGIRPVYLSLAFAQSTAVAPSMTTAGSYAALTGLHEGSTYEAFKVFVRRLYAANAAGEPIKGRVLYRFSGGAGTETAKWRMHTGASSSPFVSNNLNYTTSWTWSSWVNGMLATNASDGRDTLGLEGRLSASGPTWYVAGVQVRGAAT